MVNITYRSRVMKAKELNRLCKEGRIMETVKAIEVVI